MVWNLGQQERIHKMNKIKDFILKTLYYHKYRGLYTKHHILHTTCETKWSALLLAQVHRIQYNESHDYLTHALIIVFFISLVSGHEHRVSIIHG